jgi:hypothetical protein
MKVVEDTMNGTVPPKKPHTPPLASGGTAAVIRSVDHAI